MIRNMSVGLRIGIIAAGLGLALIATFVVTYISSSRVSELADQTESAMRNERFVVEKEVDHLKWMQSLTATFLDPDVNDVTVQLDDHKCGFGKWLYGDELASMAEDSPELASILRNLEDPHRRLHESAAKIRDLYRSGDASGQTAALAVFENETSPALLEVQKLLESLGGHFHETATADQTALHDEMAQNTSTIAIFAIVALAAGILLAWFIGRTITKPLIKLSRVAQSVAKGNLNHEVKALSTNEIGVLQSSFRDLIEYLQNVSNAADHIARHDLTVSIQPKGPDDALGNAFASMINNLTEMVKMLNSSAVELVSASTEIASAAEEMSRGAESQAEQVVQMSSAVEEMASTIVESSKNATDAASAAENSSRHAEKGGQVVGEAINGMSSISSVVKETSVSISALADSAVKIGQIIAVIDDIADQTNLLALNAAIEAARAGEQGRGFAVVAEEVRKLAERTGTATGEITDMIHGIQKQTEQAVQTMESGVTQVDHGRELTDSAGNSIKDTISQAQHVLSMIAQIAAASEQQSVAAGEISDGIQHIASVSHQSAAGARQSAQAAEELNQQANSLLNVVTEFQIGSGQTAMVDIAKQDHSRYISHLRSIIEGNAKVDSWKSVDHLGCRFGKWYYSDRTRYMKRLASFKAIEDPHSRVHESANRAIDAIRQGQDDVASQHLQTAIAASDSIMRALDELRAELSAEPAVSVR